MQERKLSCKTIAADSLQRLFCVLRILALPEGFCKSKYNAPHRRICVAIIKE